MRYLAILLLLSGCGTMTLSQTISTGYEVAADYNARTDRLIDAKAISKEDAQERVTRVSQAKVALDTASAALAGCRLAGTPDKDCWKAAGAASAARALLQEVETQLIKDAQ